jgi:hypothetical protein
MHTFERYFPNERRETAAPRLISLDPATGMPRKKKPAKPEPPVRSLDELLAESRRLEQRGRELMEQAKALASEVAEARARSENGRSARK